MTRPLLVACLVALTALAGGCITFHGDDTVHVRLLVTQDMGTERVSDTNLTLPEGSTVMDALHQAHTVTTAHGGGFVTAIDGLGPGPPHEGHDWFYHVDTALADTGAADNFLADDTLILWDHRPWNHTMTLPHVLTGLEEWPHNATQPPLETTPEAWHENTTTPHLAKNLFAHTDGDQLVLHDAHATPTHRLDPPWLILHAVQGPHEEPSLLIHASGPDAHELAPRLEDQPPTGLGIALTPDRTHKVPT